MITFYSTQPTSKKHADQLNSLIIARKYRLKLIKAYTWMMKHFFNMIMTLLKDPSYMLDVGIITYWLSKIIG